MTQSVSIAAGIEKDKKILNERLSRKELLEQHRLAFTESLKNNPESWARLALAFGAADVIYAFDRSPAGALSGMFTAAAILSPDPQPLLVAAGVLEAPNVLVKTIEKIVGNPATNASNAQKVAAWATNHWQKRVTVVSNWGIFGYEVTFDDGHTEWVAGDNLREALK